MFARSLLFSCGLFFVSLCCPACPSEVVQNDEGQDVKGVRLPIDVRLCDFDDVSYRVVIDAAALGVMKVSIALPCWGTIEANGGAAARDRIYGDLVQNPPEAGFDVTLALPLDGAALPNGESAQSLSDKVARIKTNLIGGAFDHHFQALLDGKAGTTATKFNPRSDTTVFFFPRADRVTVVFSLEFSERVDAAIAKVFMQEFVDAKRRIAAAPPCTFGVNPPLELKEFGITEPTGNLGFISFAVLKSHLEQGRKQKVIDVLAPFRTYLQYHLKCSKSYFHSRMRARVVSLLKMLNRAKVEQPDDKKEKKTMAGKTFIRSS
jgi:actin related protein 2/3 complex subunit 2